MWFSLFSSFIGVMIFLYGYIQVPNKIEIYKADSIYNKTSINKVVLVVIDALRFNMVESNGSSLYNLSEILYHNSSFTSKVKLQLPSVTMPRIKTMTSGSIGSFIDFLFNIRSTRIFDDNIIDILVEEKHFKINFYGDDTWLKLFPVQFQKTDGTTSFFVKDYFEVDKNVTRHIPSILSDINKWDMTILHYLGLDHIGHVEGPFSKLVPGKLEEMYDAIVTIVDGIIQMNKFHETLIIVTGDHGMSDLGGHGGSSQNELTTSSIFFNERLTSSRFTKPEDYIFQSDLPTSIALLTGVRIPQNSIGVIPFSLLLLIESYNDRSNALFANFQHFINQKIENSHQFVAEFEAIKSQLELIRNHCYLKHDEPFCVTKIDDNHRQLISLLRVMQRLQMSKTSTFNLPFMEVGIAFLFLSFFSMLYIYNVSIFFVSIGCLLSILFTTFLFTENFYDFLVLRIVKISLSVFFSIFFIIYFLSGRNLAIRRSCNIEIKWNWCLFLIPLMHNASYLSSSFIEEEHQLWYFLFSTFILAHMFKCLILNYRQHSNTDNISVFLQHFLLLILDRILRTLNQTGDKWSHLLDVGDWLYSPDNRMYLLTSIGVSLIIISQLLSFKYIWSNVTLTMFIGANLFYRLLSTFGYKAEFYDPFIYLCYLIIFEQLLVYIYHRCQMRPKMVKTSTLLSNYLWCYQSIKLSNILLLMVSLLCRPHNLILLAGFCIKRWIFMRIWSRYIRFMGISEQVIIFHMLGMVSFYQQGNSHNLATIDIQTGYVGISNYQPIVIAILLSIHTWFGHLFWLIVLLEWISTHHDSKSPLIHDNLLANSSPNFIGTLSLVNTAACLSLMSVCSILKHHLFVWSVFTPRLMYCCFYSLCVLPHYVLLAILSQ